MGENGKRSHSCAFCPQNYKVGHETASFLHVIEVYLEETGRLINNTFLKFQEAHMNFIFIVISCFLNLNLNPVFFCFYRVLVPSDLFLFKIFLSISFFLFCLALT